MAAPGALTLDISDPQVLIYYEDDTDGFHYHHRVLLYRGGAPGVWIALMPDGELQVHNLIAERHVILQRHSPFPSQHANQVYAFDPISRVELDAHRVRARIQARVLGTAEEEPPRRPRSLGPRRPGSGPHQRGDLRGGPWRPWGFPRARLTCRCGRGGDVVFCERIDKSDKEKWVKEHRTSSGDDRILGLHLRNGRRHLPLKEALNLFNPQKFDDWAFDGPAVVVEFLTAVDDCGGFVAYQ